MVSSKIEGIFKSDDDEKAPPTEKELKVTWLTWATDQLKTNLFQEEDKRKKAEKAAEDERRKKHVHEEYQREKKRQEKF